MSQVTVDFVVKGMPDVDRAFKTTEEAAAKAERNSQRTAEKAAKERIRISQQEAKEKIRAMIKMDAEVKRIQERAAKDVEKAARAETREVEKAGREKVRIHREAAREVERIQDRARAQARRDQERDDRAALANLERQMRQRQALTRQERQRFGGVVSGAAMGAGRLVARGAMGMASMVAQLGGGFSVTDAIRQSGDLQRNAAYLANSAIGVNGVTAKDADPAKIVARAREASITTGIDADQLVAATRSYVAKSSDFKGGMENMEFFGKLAKGTGTDIGEITKSAGLIRSQNKDLDTQGMKDMLLAVVMQGKQGAVELEDLAHSAGKITRSATSYSGSQTQNQQKLLGLSQIAMRTTGSTDSAAIALSALGSDTRNHAKDISNTLGYKILDKGGKITKSPEELIADVMAATGGNLAALGQHGGLGFTKPTMKIFEALKPDFDKAQAEHLKAHPGDTKGANAAGRAASMKEMTEITGSTMDMRGLDEMAQRVLKTPAEQFEMSMRQLRAEVGDKLLPEVIKLVPVLSDVIKSMMSIVSWASSHPFTALAGAITLSITKEIAAAQIAETIKRLISGGSGGGAGVPGAGGGVGGVVAPALATGAAAAAVITNSELGYEAGNDRAKDIVAKVAAWKKGDHERGMSPEQARQEVAAAKDRLDKHGGVLEQTANLVTSPFSTASSKDYGQYKADQGVVENEALKALIAAIQANTAATKASTGSGGQQSTSTGTPGASRGVPMTQRN